MARNSFVALRGFLVLLVLVAPVPQLVDVFASAAHVHSPSQDTTGAKPHRSIQRSAPVQRRGPSGRPLFVPRDYIPDEALTERSGDQLNTIGPNNAIEPTTNLKVASAWNGPTEYQQLGTSGVAAMQLSVVTDRYVLLFDKAEHNPLKTSDGINAWSALLDTQQHTVRALKVETNSFCAG